MTKYKYKDSGIEWFGEVPEHWKITRISERVDNIVGGEWGSDPDADNLTNAKRIAVLRVADFDGVYIKYDNITFRSVKESKIPNRLLKANSLMLEKSGGGEKQLVGRVAELIEKRKET